MTPDVVVAWPRFADYPLWRAFIERNRKRFAKVIVAFTPHDGGDISDWVRAHFDATYVIPGPGEWRDAAVNSSLEVSDAEWVWFTEQDFLITNEAMFWHVVEGKAEFGHPVGWREEGSGRVHPSCLFVRREQIDRTSRYFGPDPIDHFYRFGTEIEPIHSIRPWADGSWEHLQGTSQNHWLIDQGEDAGVFRRERFRRYLRDCLAAGVVLEPDWERRARAEVGVEG